MIKYKFPYCDIRTCKNKSYTFTAKFLPVKSKHTTLVKRMK